MVIYGFVHYLYKQSVVMAVGFHYQQPEALKFKNMLVYLQTDTQSCL